MDYGNEAQFYRKAVEVELSAALSAHLDQCIYQFPQRDQFSSPCVELVRTIKRAADKNGEESILPDEIYIAFGETPDLPIEYILGRSQANVTYRLAIPNTNTNGTIRLDIDSYGKVVEL